MPEVVRIANGGEDIVRLHPVVSIIDPQGKELRQILMPHAQLVYGYSRVVHP